MKININYISRKLYNNTNIGWWFWYFKTYTYIKGFNLRICGLHFNIRENNGTAKMLASMKK